MTEPLITSGAVRLIVAIVSLLGVGVATISVNIAANVVSPANDFANLAPRLISFKTGGVITGVLGIVMMPWKFLATADTYIFNWLIGYSALLGPIAGIMVMDYWVLRKQELDVPELYRVNGKYAGYNAAGDHRAGAGRAARTCPASSRARGSSPARRTSSIRSTCTRGSSGSGCRPRCTWG